MTDPNTEAMELWLKAATASAQCVSGDPHQAAAAIIAAKLKEYEARIEGLDGALVLAANRLDVCVVDAIADGNERRRCAYTGWAEAARQSLEADHGA